MRESADSRAECYRLLSTLFQYPRDPRDISELKKSVERLSYLINEIYTEQLLDEFAEFLNTSELWEVQEEYVRTFDIFPLCPPYISHYLYGESYKKGEYMVKLKEIYRIHGFEVPKNELPDHISVIMDFLSYLGREDRKEFIVNFVIDGLNKMRRKVEKKDTPYRQPILLSYILCISDADVGSGGGENPKNGRNLGKGVIKCSMF